MTTRTHTWGFSNSGFSNTSPTAAVDGGTVHSCKIIQRVSSSPNGNIVDLKGVFLCGRTVYFQSPPGEDIQCEIDFKNGPFGSYHLESLQVWCETCRTQDNLLR